MVFLWPIQGLELYIVQIASGTLAVGPTTRMNLTHLYHVFGGAVGQELAAGGPKAVHIVPVVGVPSGEEPDVALLLRHALLEGLTHDDAASALKELANDDTGTALLQVLQVLQAKKTTEK